MEKRDSRRVSGDLEGKTSFRWGWVGDPGGDAVSESCLQHTNKTFTSIAVTHQAELLQSDGKENIQDCDGFLDQVSLILLSC